MTATAMLAFMWFATLVMMKANGLNLRSSVVLDDGGYANVAVAIDESIQENMDLLTSIQVSVFQCPLGKLALPVFRLQRLIRNDSLYISCSPETS